LLGFQLAGGDQLNNVRYIMYKMPHLSTPFRLHFGFFAEIIVSYPSFPSMAAG